MQDRILNRGRLDSIGGVALLSAGTLLHFVSVVVVSMSLGFIPEGTIGNLYHGTPAEPFFPFMTAIAALLGLAVAHFRRDTRAVWTWIPGLLWFALGAYDLSSGGAGQWVGSTRAKYLFENLLTDRCADTECLYELFVTAPLVTSAAYALTSWITLQAHSKTSGA